MKHKQHYLTESTESALIKVVQGIDHDVERGEDVLMLAVGTIMLSTLLAPIAPPSVLLPLVALIFVISVTLARWNYWLMQSKLKASMELLQAHESALLHPIIQVFKENPGDPLSDSFNPLKNLLRTGKSCVGGLLINPFWMPIFYVMGIQISEERSLAVLNQAVIKVERRILPPQPTE